MVLCLSTTPAHAQAANSQRDEALAGLKDPSQSKDHLKHAKQLYQLLIRGLKPSPEIGECLDQHVLSKDEDVQRNVLYSLKLLDSIAPKTMDKLQGLIAKKSEGVAPLAYAVILHQAVDKPDLFDQADKATKAMVKVKWSAVIEGLAARPEYPRRDELLKHADISLKKDDKDSFLTLIKALYSWRGSLDCLDKPMSSLLEADKFSSLYQPRLQAVIFARRLKVLPSKTLLKLLKNCQRDIKKHSSAIAKLDKKISKAQRRRKMPKKSDLSKKRTAQASLKAAESTQKILDELGRFDPDFQSQRMKDQARELKKARSYDKVTARQLAHGAVHDKSLLKQVKKMLGSKNARTVDTMLRALAETDLRFDLNDCQKDLLKRLADIDVSMKKQRYKNVSQNFNAFCVNFCLRLTKPSPEGKAALIKEIEMEWPGVNKIRLIGAMVTLLEWSPDDLALAKKIKDKLDKSRGLVLSGQGIDTYFLTVHELLPGEMSVRAVLKILDDNRKLSEKSRMKGFSRLRLLQIVTRKLKDCEKTMSADDLKELKDRAWPHFLRMVTEQFQGLSKSDELSASGLAEKPRLGEQYLPARLEQNAEYRELFGPFLDRLKSLLVNLAKDKSSTVAIKCLDDQGLKVKPFEFIDPCLELLVRVEDTAPTLSEADIKALRETPTIRSKTTLYRALRFYKAYKRLP